ncbi:MAG: DUF2764 domain-containing protein [Bacteroidales bacterium]|nr:DUF2764 domain-containing protein [Bacteroidales bacterium]
MQVKRNYYYQVAGLPDLLLDEQLKINSVAFFKNEFESAIQPADFDLIKMIFLKYDNENLLNLLQKKAVPFNPLGNFSRDLFEEQLKETDKRILSYLQHFIHKFATGEKISPDQSWGNELESDYFQFLLSCENQFLKDWFQFKLNVQNVITALACRDHGLSVENQLIGNNAITTNILKSNARDFGLAQEFQEVEKILTAWQSETVLQRELAIDRMKWDWIDDKIFFYYFTIERLLGFLLQLEMVERWLRLDEEKGNQMFDKLLSGLNKDYKLPDEFSLHYVKRK